MIEFFDNLPKALTVIAILLPPSLVLTWLIKRSEPK